MILNVLAVAELVADKLPKTPNRTLPPGLIAHSNGWADVLAASAAFERLRPWRDSYRHSR